MNTSTPSPGVAPTGRWLLYGANGYTGSLIAEEAVQRGLSPIVAGRRADSILALAERLGCEHRVFSLDHAQEIDTALDGVSLVLHCAGPFADTADAMIAACLRTGTQYMDIDGEIPVLEAIFARHEEARECGITLLPGCGYDVVPTDCLALMLKEQLPDAVELRIAMGGKASLSPGTLKVTIETIPGGGSIRENGEVKRVPHAWRIRSVRFDDRQRCTITIPWGDIVTAWHSTGIPNISVSGAVPWPTAIAMRLARGLLSTLLGVNRIRRSVQGFVSRTVRGPDAHARRNNTMHLRGDVWNASGEHRCLFMHTPEGYACTVETALAILPRLLRGDLPPGAWTPAQVLGSGFATTIPGISVLPCDGV
ncbi:MAG: saccharopine dehydrogenase NADP-binding domain-containing protein [Bacteroidota bacterium]|nr:saccharopine dehydrogenase NADP-binding domain-containing protein [Bacteroidota bacterium]